MKRERRHELQHNELADWLAKAIESTQALPERHRGGGGGRDPGGGGIRLDFPCLGGEDHPGMGRS